MIVRPAVGCLLLGMVFTSAGLADEAGSLRLVPFPKEVKIDAGRFALGRPLVIETPGPLAGAVGTILVPEWRRAGLAPPKVQPSGAARQVVRIGTAATTNRPDLPAPERPGTEAYRLLVSPEVIQVTATATPGLLHGLATLAQLVRANRRDGSIACVAIRDWPSIRWRAFQDDITRGPSTRLCGLKRDVARGAMLKLNVFTYYMQDQFAFSKHPLLGPKDGSLTPGELKALVEQARPLGVDVLGNQQSFAHMEHTLAHPEYAHLKEDERTLSPVREGTYQLLDDLYSDVMPILPFEFFNVCCDETWGLGTKGPSQALAEQIGPGGVYVRHIRRVYDLVHGKYGKRMMIWGDVILHHPDKLDQIPKDVVMLTWGYAPRESFEDQIVPFARSGYEFFVCPGVSNWSRVLPDFRAAAVNIRNFVRDGAKHGALGVLNTSWDDDGENLNAPNWYGFAWGAECAWNASGTPREDFDRRVGAVLFGEPGEHFGKAIRLLSDPRVSGMKNRAFWADDFAPIRAGAGKPAVERVAIVRQAMEELEACRADATVDADLLDAVRFGARRMELVYRRQLDRVAATDAYQQALDGAAEEAPGKVDLAIEAIRRDRDAYAELRARWRQLWLGENKPYALVWSLERYDRVIGQYDQVLAKLAAARRAAVEGKPLPSAGDVRLDAGREIKESQP